MHNKYIDMNCMGLLDVIIDDVKDFCKQIVKFDYNKNRLRRDHE